MAVGKRMPHVENSMHIHPAKTLIDGGVMMMMSVYLVIGSLWIIFGIVLEPIIAKTHPEFRIVLTSVSIVWSTISLIISVYFIHKVRTIVRRVKHAGKT